MTRKSLVATVVGIAAVAAPSAFADKGGIPHDGANGKGSAEAQQQTAATAPQGKALAKGHAKTHGKALAKGHAKTHGKALAKGRAKTHGKALAKGHAKSTTEAPKSTGTPATNTHAKAGKTTICHATGSATNPYVTITISNNAIPAHQRHQDGRDIIPAPAGGCPTQLQQSQTQPSTTQQPSGSTEQPAAPSATPGTPGAAAQPTEQSGVLGTSVSGSAPTTGSSTSPTTGSSTATSPAKSGVLGATTSSGSPSASAAPAATATRAASSSKLPFTGTDVIIVAILGLAALLLGVTARRASTIKS